MTEAIATDMLRSYIDRILRLKAERVDDVAFGRTVEDRIARLRYTLEPLAAAKGDTIALSRAAVAAGRLLGVQNDTVRHRAKVVARRGSIDAALDHLSWLETPANPVWPVPPLDGDLFGLIYLMTTRDFPGVAKIGFSRSPRQRRDELQRKHRVALDLVCACPGTEFDEHMLQHDAASFALASEWFDFTGEWSRAMPVARFYTPQRMWNEMRKVA